jgi:hypothetical protein
MRRARREVKKPFINSKIDEFSAFFFFLIMLTTNYGLFHLIAVKIIRKVNEISTKIKIPVFRLKDEITRELLNK